jgi:hypothetical protein
MRTPEAELALKSQPLNKKWEYIILVAVECHGWKDVHTTGFLMREQQGYQLFKESQVYILAGHGKKYGS